METRHEEKPKEKLPDEKARWRWVDAAWWWPACAGVGAAVGCLAAFAAAYRSPLVVFPLLFGLILGTNLAALMRRGRVGHRPTILVGTLVAVAAAVVVPHYVAYRGACAVARENAGTYQRAQEAFGEQVRGRIPTPPAGFLAFLREEAARGRPLSATRRARGAAAWGTWALDGLLVAGSALGLVVAAWRRPYCGRCRSWFHTVRQGPIDAGSAAALARHTGVELPDTITAARYRIDHCAGGCAAAGFELSWQGSDGRWTSAACRLDRETRTEVMRQLDAAVQTSER